jgi:hypothetical protein
MLTVFRQDGSPAFTFAAPPKCGCTWLHMALTVSELIVERKGSTKIHYPGRVPGLPSLTFVRPPQDWLRSYYQNMQGRTCGNPHVDVLQSLPWESFPKFVESYLEKLPGQIGRIFQSYESDYYVGLDQLPEGLISTLQDLLHVGPFKRGAILDEPISNATPAILQWPPDLLKTFMEREGSSVAVSLSGAG